MSHKPIDDAKAVARHDDALAAHERAWEVMHRTRLRYGGDSPEFAADRQIVVEAAAEVRRAAAEVRRTRRWRLGVSRAR